VPLARAVRERGYYTRGEFRQICRWKTPRSAPLVAGNSAARVKRATGIALKDDTDESERMRTLRELDGVNWATASVLLHFVYPERYPILDVRVLHALGVRGRTSYSYRFWLELVDTYREIIARSGVDGRNVDRGLWQWSAEQGEPL
jgi:hypothetical protein